MIEWVSEGMHDEWMTEGVGGISESIKSRRNWTTE